MNKALSQFSLLREGQEVTGGCYYFDEDTNEHVAMENCFTLDEQQPESVMWSIPFGFTLTIGIPLKFDLDAGDFPLELYFDGNGEYLSFYVRSRQSF